MGLKKYAAWLAEWRKMTPANASPWIFDKNSGSDSPTKPLLTTDTLIVDMQLHMATLFGRSCNNGADVLKKLDAQMSLDRARGTRTFVFNFDDRTNALDAKKIERAKRSRERARRKPSDVPAGKIQLRNADDPSAPMLTSSADYKFGASVPLPNSLQDIMSDSSLLRRAVDFVFYLLYKQVTLGPGERMLLSGKPEDAQRAYVRYSGDGTALQFSDTVLNDPVAVGESECRCFYWLDVLDPSSATIRSADSDCIVLGLFAARRDIWRSETFGCDPRPLALDLSNQAGPRLIDAVSMYRSVMRGWHNLVNIKTRILPSPLETMLWFVMFTGNDYNDPLPFVTPKVLLKHAEAGLHQLPTLIRSRQTTQGMLCMKLDETALLRFLAQAIVNASKRIATYARTTTVDLKLDDVPTLFAKLRAAQAANASHTAKMMRLPDINMLRANVRRCTTSLFYYANGHLNWLAPSIEAFSTNETRVSLYGYEWNRAKDENHPPIPRVSQRVVVDSSRLFVRTAQYNWLRKRKQARRQCKPSSDAASQLNKRLRSSLGCTASPQNRKWHETAHPSNGDHARIVRLDDIQESRGAKRHTTWHVSPSQDAAPTNSNVYRKSEPVPRARGVSDLYKERDRRKQQRTNSLSGEHGSLVEQLCPKTLQDISAIKF